MGLANSVYVPYPINTLDDIVNARKCSTSAGTFHGMPGSDEMPSRSSTAAIARIMPASQAPACHNNVCAGWLSRVQWSSECLQLAHSSLSHDAVRDPWQELTGETEPRLWMQASLGHCLESPRL